MLRIIRNLPAEPCSGNGSPKSSKRAVARPNPSIGGLFRSAECEAVLGRYGLEHCSFAMVGADRRPDDTTWYVMVASDTQPEYLDVATAANVALDLLRAGESNLAERLSPAIGTAMRQSRTRAS